MYVEMCIYRRPVKSLLMASLLLNKQLVASVEKWNNKKSSFFFVKKMQQVVKFS